MSDPWKADEPIREENFINESERSVDPTDDEYKVVKLEDTGRFAEDFLRRFEVFTYDADDTFTVPDWGEEYIVEIWGAGGSGGAAHTGPGGNAAASGGAGGQYAKVTVPAKSFLAGDTIPVTIGVGGAPVTYSAFVSGSESGNAGSQTSFGDILIVSGAPGGQASGRDQPNTASVSGRNGNINAVADGSNVLVSLAANVRGGRSAGASSSGVIADDSENTNIVAAGGGSAVNTNVSPFINFGKGGESQEAGNGGNGATGRVSSFEELVVVADDGQSPGGGGGAACTGTGGSNKTATSGAGGNGRVRVTVLGKIGE